MLTNHERIVWAGVGAGGVGGCLEGGGATHDTAIALCFHCLYSLVFAWCVSTAFVSKTVPLPCVFHCLRD